MSSGVPIPPLAPVRDSAMSTWHLCQLFFKSFPELFKEVSSPWFVLAKSVQRAKPVSEELKPFQSTVNRFFSVLMQRKARHHRDIGIHGVANRHTLIAFDNAVALINPALGVQRVNKGEG